VLASLLKSMLNAAALDAASAADILVLTDRGSSSPSRASARCCWPGWPGWLYWASGFAAMPHVTGLAALHRHRHGSQPSARTSRRPLRREPMKPGQGRFDGG
jgi:hypothetical protein